MRTARENLTESRRLVDTLRPLQLDRAALPDAVRQLTSRMRDETGVTANTVVTGEPLPLEPAVEGELLRVVQEALTNVRRHAAAQRVDVTISYLDDAVAVDVHDDGSGFDPSRSPSGFGLAAMRQRINELGGAFHLESRPGEGSTVAATVSVTSPAQPSESAANDAAPSDLSSPR
jgi:signal transduction histidine kinase